MTSPHDLQFDPVEIAPYTYWVGKREPGEIFYANPYLRLYDGHDPKTGKPSKFNILIDPGSNHDFAVIQAKADKVVGGLKNLNAVFINHQDPDVASSMGMITGRFAPKAWVFCSEDTWRLVRY